ncbi:hypothetical protein MTO96_014206 [Rhipicephalus appendiculatus]
MFRGLLNAKKLVLSKLTSIDSEVSDAGTSQGSDLTVPSGNVSDTGSMTMNPAFFRQSRGGSNASFRSTVSDSEVEAGGFMMSRQMRASSIWSTKSSLSGGLWVHQWQQEPQRQPGGPGGQSQYAHPLVSATTVPHVHISGIDRERSGQHLE